MKVPLKLRYALTIHKAQGQTCERVCVHFGRKENAAGLSFVALSRVRNLNNLYVERCSLERFLGINRADGMSERRLEEKRLQNLAVKTRVAHQSRRLVPV